MSTFCFIQWILECLLFYQCTLLSNQAQIFIILLQFIIDNFHLWICPSFSLFVLETSKHQLFTTRRFYYWGLQSSIDSSWSASFVVRNNCNSWSIFVKFFLSIQRIEFVKDFSCWIWLFCNFSIWCSIITATTCHSLLWPISKRHIRRFCPRSH